MNVWWVRWHRAKAWHILRAENDTVAVCGRLVWGETEIRDKPPQAHQCGTCRRVAGPQ